MLYEVITCPSLDSLNIGGGFPIKNSLAFDFDYEYMVEEIINQINVITSYSIHYTKLYESNDGQICFKLV